MSYIELQNITFSYVDDDAPVVQNFSLSIEKGTCLILQGDNGSGKSTLFRLLNGLSFPQTGDYIFDGTAITQKVMKNNAFAKQFHKRVGYLFQDPDVMLFNARVYDEVAFGPRQLGLSDQETDTRVQDCLNLFQLTDLAGKAPYHLSGGQKKRVALAAVMALNPEVLILDEPLAGLDRKTSAWLIDFLKQLKAAGKTLIIATHNDRLRSELADQVCDLTPEEAEQASQ